MIGDPLPGQKAAGLVCLREGMHRIMHRGEKYDIII